MKPSIVPLLAGILLGVAVAGTPAQAGAATRRAADPCASLPSKWQRLQCRQARVSAPGDEYFGRMKMSYLGIDNTFHDAIIRAGAYTTDPHLIGQVHWADDALHAWAARYPRDPQLPRSYFLAAEAYAKIYTPAAQREAWQYYNLIARRYPETYFGRIAKKDLAIGFTEHWFAKPQPCGAPTPTPTPSPAKGALHIEILPVPCIAPEASPAPRRPR